MATLASLPPNYRFGVYFTLAWERIGHGSVLYNTCAHMRHNCPGGYIPLCHLYLTSHGLDTKMYLTATQTHKLGLLSGLRSGLSFQWRFRKELAPGQIRALCSMRIFLFCRLPWGGFFFATYGLNCSCKLYCYHAGLGDDGLGRGRLGSRTIGLLFFLTALRWFGWLVGWWGGGTVLCF
jgi:hypothetical protein